MRERGFSLADFIIQVGPAKDDECRHVFDQLLQIEKQAVEIVQLVKMRGYVTPDSLFSSLENHPLPAIDLGYVAAFLAGFYAAASWESDFETRIFGSSLVMSDSKDVHIKAAMGTLLTMMREKSVAKLPDRTHLKRPVQRPVRVARKGRSAKKGRPVEE